MMTSTPSVRELFTSTGDGKPISDLRLPPVPGRLAKLVTGFEWKGLAGHVFDLLDLSVVDILVGGWKKQQEVRAQLALSVDDPSKTILVHLAEHTITSTHNSSIHVRSGGRTLMEVSVPIELSFEVKAVELTLRGGGVCEIRTGEVQVEGTVKIEDTTVLTRELTTVHLPGTILLEVAVPASIHRHEATEAVM